MIVQIAVVLYQHSIVFFVQRPRNSHYHDCLQFGPITIPLQLWVIFPATLDPFFWYLMTIFFHHLFHGVRSTNKVTPSGVGVSENRAMFQFLEPKKNPFSHHFLIIFPIFSPYFPHIFPYFPIFSPYFPIFQRPFGGEHPQVRSSWLPKHQDSGANLVICQWGFDDEAACTTGRHIMQIIIYHICLMYPNLLMYVCMYVCNVM